MDLIERANKKEEKKKKGVSLVERAAELSGAPAAVGLGVPKSKLEPSDKRDPSSLNPALAGDEQSAKPKAFKGIGAYDPDAVKQSRVIADEKKIDDTSSTEVIALQEEQPQQSNLSAPRKQKRREEEVDLVALREGGYITPDMPPNLMSEEFRIIKRSILLNAFSKGVQRDKNSNVILVTSSNPGEGKTFCTINLALSIATEQDTTVLLIDADFSKPEVLNRLGVAGGRGLMDVVADEDLELGDCLIRTNIPNLVLLPAGRQHNLTTELLASERMQMIVEELANRYPDRLIIFDSPPVLASSAASVLALYMGQCVFVIEAEQTTEPQIKESLNMISACDNINLLLNQTRFSGSNKKFASYYGYGGR
ncbi:XrtA-associated tyrosine autokinase [Kordiimonas sp. SCSIO 12603]|uniref:XrtA-associated tyrosine autokinase n=1 Tax=Kordiimonas sp. SCSIO 12603 TaxID=2829596 RepID=UPI0021078F6C|nr:XrtA-associated tyrosine autokinase [Kordiimonas sp. SCSIO 12603]UTW57585.1 XrtA-associated tyrosine autokinase [Kordiimonas sp. SCSIO 12603]